jgi:hypothetical protein
MGGINMAIIRVGDDLIDDETGEYAGSAVHGWPAAIISDDDALFISRQIMQAEVDVYGRQCQLDAVIENVAAMLRRSKSKLEYLRSTYGTQLERYAWENLPRRADGTPAAKTYTNPFIQCRFVTVKPKVVIHDEEKAMAFIERHAPDAVVVEKRVLISKLDDQTKSELMGDESLAAENGFVIEPEKQSFKMTTGVSKK